MTAVEVSATVSGRTRPDSSAPVVVLAHSLGCTRAMWDPQLAALEEHFWVVTYDARGHGASPVPTAPYVIDDLADDVVALLDRLEVEKAHFVGLSLGGMAGMSLAARHPERVDRLALLCTAAWVEFGPMYAERAQIVRAAGSVADLAEAIVARWFTPPWIEANPRLTEEFEATVAATPAEGYAAACEAIAGMDLRPVLGHITARTLVVSGADDLAIPTSYQQSLAAGIPDSRLVVVPDAAHIANVEQTATITSALIAHLTED